MKMEYYECKKKDLKGEGGGGGDGWVGGWYASEKGLYLENY